MEIQNYIGGEFVPAESKKTFAKISPFTGEVLAQVADSDAIDVIKALQFAKKSQPVLKEIPLAERALFLENLADAIGNHADEYALAEALDQGLPHDFSFTNNVQVGVKNLTRVAESLKHFTGDEFGVQPSGVIGIITTWGLSLRLVLERLAPAFAAGNPVIVKVSEHAPMTAKILGQALTAANFPVGAVGILHGGPEVGALIAGHPGIRSITACGKSSTMEKIARAALPHFKKLQLSGGAKNPALVLADFDVKNNIEKILAPFLIGQGQLCWNTTRLFVVESAAPALLEAAEKYLSDLRPLENPRGTSSWTPMITSLAGEEIHRHILSGKEERGKIFSGGEPPLQARGYFIKPTVMLDLTNCSVLQQEELRGPLLLITPVKYQHEAVKWANTSYLAHSGIVWGSAEKFAKVAGQLELAHVSLNSWMEGEVRTIFGHKQSSFGNPEMAWSGSFYSDVKKLAGT